MPRILPWLELNRATPGLLDTLAAGLAHWRTACTAVILSVDASDPGFLQDALARVPDDLLVIPGLKTSPLLVPAGITDRDAWRRLAAAVRTVTRLTGSARVLLEHESTAQPYLPAPAGGGRSVDAAALRRAVALLPAGRTYLWYPTVDGSGPRLRARLTLLSSAVAALDTRLVPLDHATLYAPTARFAADTQACRAALVAECPAPPVDLVYACLRADGSFAQWPSDRLREAVGLAHSREVIVYPGQANWVAAAQALAG